MIERDKFTERLTNKLADMDNQSKIADIIQKIVSGVDYELRKFNDYSASFLLSMNPHISSLYNFSSYQDFKDQQAGISRVMHEITYIRDNYEVDLTNDVRKYVYAHLNNLKEDYYAELAPKHAGALKSIIKNRDVWSQNKIIQEMESILQDLLSSDSTECRQLVKLMLQVDPFFQSWRNSEKYHTFFPPVGHAHHHSSDESPLSFDFLNPVVNFLTKIYHKFSDKQESKESKDEKRFDNKIR